MGSDVKATNITATGTVHATRSRIRGFMATHTVAGGTITIRDGGSGGATVLVFEAPAVAGIIAPIELPDRGILCATDIHATFPVAVTSLTVFYEG